MSKGKKDDSKKPSLDLIPVEFEIGIAKAFDFGAIKYGKHNFKDGLQYTRLLAAAIRHLKLELAGVNIDKDSGLEHWALAGASIAMYSFMKSHRPELDDRYQYTDAEKERIVRLMYEGDRE